MYRIFILAFLCLVAFPTHAQVLLQLRSGAYDSDAQAYFNTLVANSCTTPSVAFEQAVSAYIVAERAAGNWGNQDAEYILTTADSCTAAINLAQPSLYKVTWSGSPSFAVQTGFPCDGSTQYGDTNVAENALTRRSQNNGHIEQWLKNAPASNGYGISVINSTQTRINAVTNKASLLNTSSGITDTGGGGAGFHTIDRSNSSTSSTYKNGGVQTSGAASTSNALATGDISIGRANTLFCPVGTDVLFVGEGQVMNNEATHYTNVRNLLLALGVTGI